MTPKLVRILIEGPSGSGKSTIGKELLRQGYDVIDADRTLGYFGKRATEEPIAPPQELTEEWYENNGWFWRRSEAIRILDDTSREHIFFCGGSDNQESFHSHFSRIFLLHCSDETLVNRIKARHYRDVTGSPFWIETMLVENRAAESRAKEVGAILVNTDRPLTDVVREILDHTNRK